MSHLQEVQYKDSFNFNARINLHRKFGTNDYPWPYWVFDHIRKDEDQKILEIGCGNALLWKLNAKKIPKSWEIVLSDFSEGMLDDAKKGLNINSKSISFEILSAEDIPYEKNTFDIIIANHMLYHVPDREKALSEICRVLKTDGIFYATTLRSNYMMEMVKLIKEYKSKPFGENEVNSVIDNFSIDNGESQLSAYFNTINLMIYENLLIINEAGPLVDYIYSINGISEKKIVLLEKERGNITQFVNSILDKNKDIVMSSDFGLFICQNII